MFKKSLVAVAVLGATAFSAQAADVTLYGKIDTGLLYQNHQTEVGGEKVTDVDSFSMENGINSASRFGLKGTEDLGNGLKVGFKLENGFKSDDGALKTANTLFDREASMSLMGDFGTLSMGRMGGVASSAGTYNLVYSIADAFDGGSNSVLGLAKSSRYNNMLTYQSPKFAGMQATVQYSFKEGTDDGREGSAATDRYAAAALTGEFGALNTVFAYEWQNYASNDGNGTAYDHEDGHTIYLGGNYDCGFAKTFAMAQYFKGVQTGNISGLGVLGDHTVEIAQENVALDDLANAVYNDGLKGYGLHLGTVVPVGNGDLTVAAYYVDGTAESSYAGVKDHDFDYLGLATKYEYRLSKRTSVYTGAGYAKVSTDSVNYGNFEIVDAEDKVIEAFVGLTHNF